MFLASGCSSVSSYWGGGLTGYLMGVATAGCEATACWGVIVGGEVGGGSSISKKIGGSSVSSIHGGLVCTWGRMVREGGWAAEGWGATARWGAVVGVSTVAVSSTSKNRPSHHKHKSPKQFELKQT